MGDTTNQDSGSVGTAPAATKQVNEPPRRLCGFTEGDTLYRIGSLGGGSTPLRIHISPEEVLRETTDNIFQHIDTRAETEAEFNEIIQQYPEILDLHEKILLYEMTVDIIDEKREEIKLCDEHSEWYATLQREHFLEHLGTTIFDFDNQQSVRLL